MPRAFICRSERCKSCRQNCFNLVNGNPTLGRYCMREYGCYDDSDALLGDINIKNGIYYDGINVTNLVLLIIGITLLFVFIFIFFIKLYKSKKYTKQNVMYKHVDADSTTESDV